MQAKTGKGISKRRLKSLLAQAVREWLESADERLAAGTHGPKLIQTIPEGALSLIFGYALLKESTILKWLTIALLSLTAVLAYLTWRLAFPA